MIKKLALIIGVASLFLVNRVDAAPLKIEGKIKQVRTISVQPPYTFDYKPVKSIYLTGKRDGKDFDYQYMVVKGETKLVGISYEDLKVGVEVKVDSRPEPPGMVGKPISEIRQSRYGTCNFALTVEKKSSTGDEMIIYPNESKYYNIVDRHSGMVIDVSGWSEKNGGNIHKWSSSGGNNQQWKFQHLGGGWHKIISRHSGMVIDVSSWSKSDGANIHQWSWASGQNQQWKLVDVGNGYVKIIARHSGKALSTKNRNNSNGDNIHQWTYKSAANQQWKLVAH